MNQNKTTKTETIDDIMGSEHEDEKEEEEEDEDEKLIK